MENLGGSFTQTYHHQVYPAIKPSQKSLSASGKVVLVTSGGLEIASCEDGRLVDAATAYYRTRSEFLAASSSSRQRRALAWERLGNHANNILGGRCRIAQDICGHFSFAYLV